jgi:hypothetical protein
MKHTEKCRPVVLPFVHCGSPLPRVCLCPVLFSPPSDIVNTPKPDERAIMTYVSCFYHAFAGAEQVLEPRVGSRMVCGCLGVVCVLHSFPPTSVFSNQLMLQVQNCQ